MQVNLSLQSACMRYLAEDCQPVIDCHTVGGEFSLNVEFDINFTRCLPAFLPKINVSELRYIKNSSS